MSRRLYSVTLQRCKEGPWCNSFEGREEGAPEKLHAALASNQFGSSTSSAPNSLCDLQPVA